MPSGKEFSMKYICPLIAVNDINISKRFYSDIMKQKVQYDFGENVSFEGGFSIHLKTHFAQLINQKPITSPSHNFEIYFEFNDVDSFAKELKEQKIELIHDVIEQPWKQKSVRFYDPDKHIIEVGESMENVAYRLSKEGKRKEEISGLTGMPVEFVSEAINKMVTKKN